MKLLFILFVVLSIGCSFFLLRAANTFLFGRKHVDFSFLKKSIVRDAVIGLCVIPCLLLLSFVGSLSSTEEEPFRVANPAFLLGNYALTSGKGKMTFAVEGEAQTISIRYKNGSTLTGTYLVTSLDSTAEQASFVLNVSGQWKQKRKTTPYEHGFSGVLKDGSLTLTSMSDNSVISAVRTANL